MTAAVVGIGELRSSSLIIGTHVLQLDEPCLGLYEITMQSPKSRGFHRYQIFKVMRGDRVAEYQRDMGPIEQWVGVDQIRIPGGAQDEDTGRIYIEHTVGELMDIADAIRNEKLFDKRELIGVDRIKER